MMGMEATEEETEGWLEAFLLGQVSYLPCREVNGMFHIDAGKETRY